MHVQAKISQPPLYAYVSFQQIHSVDEHGGMKHDELCLFIGKRNLIFGILLPNPFEWQGSFY